MSETILEVKELRKEFDKKRHFFSMKKETFPAVDGVSFEIKKGECVGLIGESGSGKSTTAYMTAGLLKPDRGEIIFHGAYMQMIFQDPVKALNPRKKILDCILEGLIYRRKDLTKEEKRRMAYEAMDVVRLDRSYGERYSRELSGGECQRATIARAILDHPELLICDEVTSALDVSVQAQIIRLLDRLKREMGHSYLFICHDISLVDGFCDRVIVMRNGKIVEAGETAEVLGNPKEDYTKMLMDSVLKL